MLKTPVNPAILFVLPSGDSSPKDLSAIGMASCLDMIAGVLIGVELESFSTSILGKGVSGAVGVAVPELIVELIVV